MGEETLPILIFLITALTEGITGFSAGNIHAYIRIIFIER